MKQHSTYFRNARILGIMGLLFILSGLWLLTFETPTVHAQTQVPEDAEYIGARECKSCHRSVANSHDETRHALTLQEADDEAVLGDFTQGEDVRLVQFPGDDTPRSFTADDIAYAIGSGREIQRYLYEVEDKEYRVLPAEWNVTEQIWQPYTPAESWDDPAYDWTQSCAGCHTTGLNPDRGRWEDDGVQCESCHGPGSMHEEAVDDASNNPSEEELLAIRSTIVESPDPQICGQCHSQGVSLEDGQLYPVGYLPGTDLSEVFTLSAPQDSAHWRQSGHGSSQNMQYNEWLLSGHANALENLKSSLEADDSCLTCHSADYQWTERIRAAYEAGDREGESPDVLTLENATYGVTCSSCHAMHGEAEYDYQLVNEEYDLCISCHGDNDELERVHFPVREMYEGISVIEGIDGVPSKHFTEGVECTTCHMPLTLQNGQTWYSGSHTMTPVFPADAEEGQPDSCTSCHTDLSRDYMQEFVEEAQSNVLTSLTDIQVALGSDSEHPDWVNEALAFVSHDGSLGVHNYSYTKTLLDTVKQETGIVEVVVPQGVPVHEIEDPTTCAECHMDEYRTWQTSPHASASLGQTFQQQYAESGRPTYCMSCHASGYDPRTQDFVFEGVVCSNCHYTKGATEHPPGPVEIATDSSVCGQCHTGEHAPAYEEWLVSSHGTAGIDCADCHTAHDNGLILENVNATCSSCHEEAMADEIHMGEDMNCVDCHMTWRVQEDGAFTTRINHTMGIDPGVCSDCHGNIHLLGFGDIRLSQDEVSELTTLREEVTDMEETASDNLNNGIVGGAIGALALAVILFFAVRLGRMR